MRQHHTKIALFWRDLHKHETDHEDDAAESGIGDVDGLLDQRQDGGWLGLNAALEEAKPAGFTPAAPYCYLLCEVRS
jgi:hypothetical protein